MAALKAVVTDRLKDSKYLEDTRMKNSGKKNEV
jgi:hypothetical protein